MLKNDLLEKLGAKLDNTNSLLMSGYVKKVVGLVLESEGPKAPIGDLCYLEDRFGNRVNRSEIVGFKDDRILSMVLGDLSDISPGMKIVSTDSSLSVKVGDCLLGRILDGLGEPMDGKGDLKTDERRSIYASPPNPLTRKRISEVLSTGVRAIDGLLTLGKGQRVGIFAGSGVGKSTLIGMIARNTSADINVIALIGERGREVKEFLEKDLGEEGLKRSVVIIATSDAAPLVRVKAALVATTIAEYFRDKGKDVMLMMDSATRLAMAQREVGLSIGEPPTSKGYTPSVFSVLQKMMERAGTAESGSITGMYTVLVEGDDMNDPVADAARGILDGHVVLSRQLASMGHYPAIDILQSISRCRTDVTINEEQEAVIRLQELMATYRTNEDMINVGAYQKGTNPRVDQAIAMNDAINFYLRQRVSEKAIYQETSDILLELAGVRKDEQKV